MTGVYAVLRILNGLGWLHVLSMGGGPFFDYSVRAVNVKSHVYRPALASRQRAR
jgi:hypothetical protein